ncbi:hypothetical protein ACWDV4_25295 [Micromonospora sp. NPDC003197]
MPKRTVSGTVCAGLAATLRCQGGRIGVVVGTCRALGGYEPDLRHRSSDADVQLELVRAATAVALMPTLTLPSKDPALAIRDIAETTLKRLLAAATRDTPPAPALTALLAAVTDQVHHLDPKKPWSTA